ncbi:MAG TPA: TlpA disulfide reductase family protein [Acidimicrobiales bacterium]|nr:TlpA disulfide reductase family protein [Acidimicrobiales bacterium]
MADAPPRPLPAGLRRRFIVSSVVLVALLALVVVGLVSAAGFDAPASVPGSAAHVGRSQPTGPVTITTPGYAPLSGGAAPAFSLPELRHPAVKVTLASLAGKPVVLNFWSSTCTVCLEESPAIVAADRLLGRQVRFVGVDTLDISRAAGLRFAGREQMSYVLLSDSSASTFDRYESPGLPTTFFISPSGRMVAENLGAISSASLVMHLERLFGVRPG